MDSKLIVGFVWVHASTVSASGYHLSALSLRDCKWTSISSSQCGRYGVHRFKL